MKIASKSCAPCFNKIRLKKKKTLLAHTIKTLATGDSGKIPSEENKDNFTWGDGTVGLDKAGLAGIQVGYPVVS